MKSKIKISTILIFLLLALVLIAVSGQKGCESLPECYSDTDCVKVQTTCCPCNMGGVEQCLPSSMASIYKDRLNNSCPPQEQLVCTALYNCKETKCTCINGKCGEE